jgi:hypothetical protein
MRHKFAFHLLHLKFSSCRSVEKLVEVQTKPYTHFQNRSTSRGLRCHLAVTWH